MKPHDRKRSPKITICLSEEQLEAAEKICADHCVSLSEWVRSLIAKATGVEAELPQGFAAMTKKEVQAAAKRGGWPRSNES